LIDNKLGPGHWRNNREERKRVYDLLLERSYCVPWVLQHYGQLLVQHLESRRSSAITWEDVNTILSQNQEGNVIWQEINNIDYKSLGYREVEKAVRPGFRLILFALARKCYFLGGPQAPIRDPHLRDRHALDLGFTVREVQKAVEETMNELLIGRKRDALEN